VTAWESSRAHGRGALLIPVDLPEAAHAVVDRILDTALVAATPHAAATMRALWFFDDLFAAYPRGAMPWGVRNGELVATFDGSAKLLFE
jgi:hypothetical protein